MTSPFALHQYLLNADDVAAPAMLRYFTFLDHETIRDLDEATSDRSARASGPARRGQRHRHPRARRRRRRTGRTGR